MARYGQRFVVHRSDLFDPHWLPSRSAPFDAVVSSSCLHNLRDFGRIRQIYGEIREHLKPGGIFLNLDLVNAPTAELHQRYRALTAARREREGISSGSVETMVHGRSVTNAGRGPFPATLEEQLAALIAAGFKDVDCFWKELGRALVGGYA